MPHSGDNREWDASQWASPTRIRPASESSRSRWTKDQWIGDRGGARTRSRVAARDMAEGEPGLSGYRHNPGAQHWRSGEGRGD